MSEVSAPGLPPRVADSRRAPRVRTLQTGKLTYRGGEIVVPCSIKDISATGARITLPKDQVIPTHVVLIHPRTQMAYEAKISWIKAPNFGLKFLQEYSLQKELPPHLKYLARMTQ